MTNQNNIVPPGVTGSIPEGATGSIAVSSNIAAGLKLLEEAIIFFETVEAGKYTHVIQILNVVLSLAKFL